MFVRFWIFFYISIKPKTIQHIINAKGEQQRGYIALNSNITKH